ncbi:hypothetical protein [Mumia sp. DW29H23]|uniref:hypothetical protein n=1 Tax=Mumia sp. DW29H23 TaxID=3421241 RepID=UPI003D6812FE
MTSFVAPGPRQPLVVGPAIVAPLLLLLAGLLRVADRVDGSYGGGAAWDLGHAMLLFAFLLLGVLVVGLGRVVDRRRSPAAVAALIAAGTGGAAATSWVVLGELYPSVASVTPASGAVLQLGLLLLVVAVVSLLVLLVERRALPGWSPVVVVAAAVVATIDLDLTPFAAALVLVGLAPLTDLRLPLPARPPFVRG